MKKIRNPYKQFTFLLRWYFKTHHNQHENLLYWQNLLNNLLLTNSYSDVDKFTDIVNTELSNRNYNYWFVYDCDKNKYDIIGKLDL